MNINGRDYSYLSVQGRRSYNEDQTLCSVKGEGESNRVIVAVADGIGSAHGGDYASEVMKNHLDKLEIDGLSNDFRQTAEKVMNCIAAANNAVIEESKKIKDISKSNRMGTTVSGAIVIGNFCLFFNVGDSRTYVIKPDSIKRFTKDHASKVEYYSHGITRAVGTDPEVKVDISPYDDFHKLEDGDVIFCCTDGLWGKVTDEEIRSEIFAGADIHESLINLYKLAYAKGSTDNISMAAYRYGNFIGPERRRIKLTDTHTKPFKIPFYAKLGIAALLLILFLYWATRIKGGGIQFFPPGGEYNEPVSVQLSFKPLQYSIGIPIESCVVYNIIKDSELTQSKKYETGEVITIKNEGSNTLEAWVSEKNGNRKGKIFYQQYTIQYKVDGGHIEFKKPEGEYKDQVQVSLNFEPLRLSGGIPIDSNIFYTIDGSEPTWENGEKYKSGELIPLTREGETTLKARMISTDGKYKGPIAFRIYTIIKKISNNSNNKKIPDPGSIPNVSSEIKIINDLNLLSLKTQNDIFAKITKIFIDVEVNSLNIKKNENAMILLYISPNGAGKVESIAGIKVEPNEKLSELQNALTKSINDLAPPTDRENKPIQVRIWINFSDVYSSGKKVIFSIKNLKAKGG